MSKSGLSVPPSSLSRKRLGPAIGDMDLRLLRVFRAVVERGGLSAAQVELGLGLATISKHLADLEVRLSMRLCSRGHERFRLTEQGEVVYRATLDLFASIDQLRQHVGSARQEIVGEVNLAIVDSTVTDDSAPVIRAIGELRRQAPLVRLRVVVAAPDDIEMGLLNGRLTLGVIPAFRQLPGLDYIPLYEETSQLYCAVEHLLFARPDEEIGPDELVEQAYVDRGYVESPAKTRLVHGLTPSATAGHVEGVAMLVLSGGFIGFLPVHYAAPWCAIGRMRPLLPDTMSYSTRFCLARRKSAKTSRLLDFLLTLMLDPGASVPKHKGNASASH